VCTEYSEPISGHPQHTPFPPPFHHRSPNYSQPHMDSFDSFLRRLASTLALYSIFQSHALASGYILKQFFSSTMCIINFAILVRTKQWKIARRRRKCFGGLHRASTSCGAHQCINARLCCPVCCKKHRCRISANRARYHSVNGSGTVREFLNYLRGLGTD
jgi:hypothetical protein